MGLERQHESYSESESAAIPGGGGGLSVRQRAVSLGLFVAVTAALLWLAFHNPLSQSFLPRCPTEQYAGFYCPGCGATRATHHMLQGRPAVAMSYNPLLVVVGTPLILLTLGTLVYQAATGRKPVLPRLPAFVGWLAVAVTIGFAVVRNLPGEAFEVMRPTPVEEDRARLPGVGEDR